MLMVMFLCVAWDHVEARRAQQPVQVRRMQSRPIVTSLSMSEQEGLLGLLNATELDTRYRTSVDGTSYWDLLGYASGLGPVVLVIRKDQYLFGAYISEGIQMPDGPTDSHRYDSDVLWFSLAGHFPKPTKMNITRQQIVDVAGRKYGNTSAVIEAGVPLSYLVHHHLVHLRLGEFPETGITSCYQYTPSENVPAGYTGERDEGGNALLGGSKYSMADEIEVLHVAGQ